MDSARKEVEERKHREKIDRLRYIQDRQNGSNAVLGSKIVSRNTYPLTRRKSESN